MRACVLWLGLALTALYADDDDLPPLPPDAVPGEAAIRHPDAPTQKQTPVVPVAKVADPSPLPKQLVEALTPQMNQVVTGNLQAVEGAREIIDNEVRTGRIEQHMGEELKHAVQRLSDEARATRETPQHRIDHNIGADLSELRDVAAKSQRAAGKSSGDVSSALASEAFRQHQGQGEVPVVDVGTRFFSNGPRSMDSAATRLQVYKNLDRTYVPPPSTDTVRSPKGVKILIDDAILGRVIKDQGQGSALEEMEALEDAVLGARDGQQVVEKVEAYVESKMRAFLDATQPFHKLENVRLVSLKSLYGILEPYRAHWGERPADLRTLGGLTRIHGFARIGDDVLIVGRVEPNMPPITVDNFIVALENVWKNGLTPGCSLDPEPENRSGPQHVRIFGVPKDSAFAKIMLDADYAMKKINHEEVDAQLNIPGHRTLMTLLFEYPNEDFDNRFWLCPIQPTTREIQVGPDGLSALFDARVQLKTETMLSAEQIKKGAKPVSNVCEIAASSFTQHYGEIADKMPIFKELQGLFDLTLMARTMRHLLPNDVLLNLWRLMPYERISVPKTYAGITTRSTRNGVRNGLVGGCDIRLHVERKTLAQAKSASLSKATESWKTGTHITDLGGTPFNVPVGTSNPGEQAYFEGLHLLSKDKFDDARDMFTAAIAANDGFAAAWAMRGVTRFCLGQRTDALWDAAFACRLDPQDLSIRGLYYQLRLEAELPDAMAGASDALRKELYAQYMARAETAVASGATDEAVSACSRAIATGVDDYKGYSMRASIHLYRRELDRAEDDATCALKTDPADIRALVTRARVRIFGEKFVDAIADLDSVLKLCDYADYYVLRSIANLCAGNLKEAQTDAEKAILRDPRSQAVATVGMLTEMFIRLGPDKVREEIVPFLRLPPEYMELYSRATMATQFGQSLEAAWLLTRALAVLEKRAGEPSVKNASFVRERVQLQLLTTLSSAAAAPFSPLSPKDAKARILEIFDDLHRKHPTWSTPWFGLAVAFKDLKDPEEAIKAIDECLKLDPDADPMLNLLHGVPGYVYTPTLLLMKLNALASRAGEDPRRLIATLDELAARAGTSPAKHAVLGLRDYFSAFDKIPDISKEDVLPPPAVLKTMHTRLEPLAHLEQTPNPFESFLIASFYLVLIKFDATQQPERVEELLKNLLALPVSNPFSPAAQYIPELRATAIGIVYYTYLRRLPPQPSAETDPDVHEAALRKAFAELMGRADRIGEPALTYLLKEDLRRTVPDHRRIILQAQIDKLQKLADLTSDPANLKTIQDQLEAKRTMLRAVPKPDEATIRSGIVDAYRLTGTLTQVRTLDAVLRLLQRTLTDESAKFYTLPEENLGLVTKLQLKEALPSKPLVPRRPQPVPEPKPPRKDLMIALVAIGAAGILIAGAFVVLRRAR